MSVITRFVSTRPLVEHGGVPYRLSQCGEQQICCGRMALGFAFFMFSVIKYHVYVVTTVENFNLLSSF